MKGSLRRRLLLAYVGLILGGFILVALLAGRQISAGTVEDFRNQLGQQAELVARVLAEPVEEIVEHGESASFLQSTLQTYADQTGARVTLLDRNGGLWISSDGTGTQPPSDAIEVEAARVGNVGTDTRTVSGDEMAYAAAPIREDGRVIAIVQLTRPLEAAEALVVRRWLSLGGAVVGVTLVAGVAALWLSATLTRPLGQLRDAALEVAQGDFSRRLPEDREDEVGEVARAFNHMADQVESMLEEQRAFAGNASHELRTPLTTIRLRSEAVRAGAVDDETAARYIAEIDDEVQRLGDLVQDLILLSRVDSGRMEPGREEIDLRRLAEQLLREIAPQARRREIALELDAPDELLPVTAGQTHLAIVFRNLLSNALKYTPDGGRISWQMRATESAVHCAIADTGHGIATDDLPRLFERFYRADKSRSRAVSGVGLGLSLVRSIVEAYGGTIEIESPGLEQGTTVLVRWPIAPGGANHSA